MMTQASQAAVNCYVALEWPLPHGEPVDGATQYQLELAEDYHTSTRQFELFESHPYKQRGWFSATSLALDPWLRLNRDYFIRLRPA